VKREIDHSPCFEVQQLLQSMTLEVLTSEILPNPSHSFVSAMLATYCMDIQYMYINISFHDRATWCDGLFFKEPGTVLAVCICPKLSCWTDLARLKEFHAISKMFPNSQRKKDGNNADQ